MTTDTTAVDEQEQIARVRAVAKAEALIEAGCALGGTAGVQLHRRAETYLRQAARLHPLVRQLHDDRAQR